MFKNTLSSYQRCMQLLLASIMFPLSMWGADGDTFTAQSIEGVDVIYKIIDDNRKTVTVGTGVMTGTEGDFGRLGESAVDTLTSGVVTIPETVNGYSVVAISDYAFQRCGKVTEVKLPETVKEMGSYVFQYCYQLVNVNIPMQVPSLETNLFAQCRSLESIYISKNVKYISDAFWDCQDLRKIVIDEDNPYYDSRNNCNAIIITSKNELRQGCIGTKIPEGIVEISEYAFATLKKLETIDLPSSLQGIGRGAFQMSGLRKITLPAGLKRLKYEPLMSYVFYDCPLDTVVAKMNSPITIDHTTFLGKSNNLRIFVPDGRKDKYAKDKYWSRYSLYEMNEMGNVPLKSFVSVNIGNGVEMSFYITSNEPQNRTCVVGKYGDMQTWVPAVDQNCQGDIVIPETILGRYRVTGISDNAFQNCTGITSVKLPESITSIGSCAFQGCTGMQTINLTNNLTEIKMRAFSGCASLRELTLPRSISALGYATFENCASLEDLFIPKEMTGVNNSFMGCIGVKTVTVEEGNPVYDSRENCNGIIKTEENKLVQGFVTTVIPSSVTIIGKEAYCGLTTLKSFEFPAWVSKLEYRAFCGTGLTEIHIPATLTEINSYFTFAHCDQLCKITVSEDHPIFDSRQQCNAIIVTATNKLFAGCRTTVVPEGVTSIGQYAFAGNAMSQMPILPASVTAIEVGAFEECPNLSLVELPASLTFLDLDVFFHCERLTTVVAHPTEPINIFDRVFAYDYYGNDRTRTYDNGTLYVPKGSRSNYLYARNWSSFSKIVEFNDVVRQDSSVFIAMDDKTAVFADAGDISGELSIPDTITQNNQTYTVAAIGDGVFQDNTQLTAVSIPASVASIGKNAFAGCTGLQAIYAYNPVPVNIVEAQGVRGRTSTASESSTVFEGVDKSLCILYVPKGSEEAYREADGWNQFEQIVGIHSKNDPAVTVTMKSYTREYGEENPAFEFTTEGAALDGEPVIECMATPASDAGTYDIVVKKGTVENYNDTYVNGTLTITKAPLTVTVADVTREQYEENPSFVISYEGWKLQDDESVLAKKPIATTTAKKDSPVGEYEIVVTGGEATNYELSYVKGTLTVIQSTGIVDFAADGQTFDVYTPSGLVVRKAVTTLKGLKKGVYIVNDRKYIVK